MYWGTRSQAPFSAELRAGLTMLTAAAGTHCSQPGSLSIGIHLGKTGEQPRAFSTKPPKFGEIEVGAPD